jgi:flagellar basal body L-ring protein FlgH
VGEKNKVGTMVVRHWLTRASPSPHVSHLEHRLNATTFKMSIVLYYMKKKKFASLLLLEIDTKRKIVASSSSKRRNINRFTLEYAATIVKVLEFGTV